MLVTDQGIAVNPARADLHDRLVQAGLRPVAIAVLHRRAHDHSERVPTRARNDDIVAVSEYRDGTITDVIRRI